MEDYELEDKFHSIELDIEMLSNDVERILRKVEYIEECVEEIRNNLRR